jgi:hypothetical protein
MEFGWRDWLNPVRIYGVQGEVWIGQLPETLTEGYKITKILGVNLCRLTCWYKCLCAHVYWYRHYNCVNMDLYLYMDVKRELFSPMVQQHLVGQGLLIIEASRSHSFRHSTFGRTPLDEWSARRRDLYQTTHNTHKRRTSMPPVGKMENSPMN